MRYRICFKVTTYGGKSMGVGWGLERHYRLFRSTWPRTIAHLFGYDLLVFRDLRNAYRFADPDWSSVAPPPKLYLCLSWNLRIPERMPATPSIMSHLYLAIDGDAKGFQYLMQRHPNPNTWQTGTRMADAVIPLIRIPVFRKRRRP